jgi:hypothetical protein
MLNITRHGSTVAEVLTSVRSIPKTVFPYAAATALTRTVKIAQADVVAEMRRSFDQPTAYTLNSTFIVPAKKDQLTARVGIKNTAGKNTTPEHFLFPEVRGGQRREKRFEAAMRHAGFMKPGERAMPGAGVALDGNGNVSAGTIRSILRQAGGQGSGARIFAGTAGRKGTRGIWQRDGKGVKPLFVFTTSLPSYRGRLDFDAAADKAARANFATEFYKAATEIRARNP